MSILTVNNLSHSFGDKEIFNNVSFRLLRGEHVGIVGANGLGKSTFMNIITSKLLSDDGNIEWSSKVKVGYLDQHTNLNKQKSIRNTLKEAYQELYALENEMEELYNSACHLNEIDMYKALERASLLQNTLISNDFYSIDSKVEAVAAGLGLRDLGLDKSVEELSGGQRTKVLLAKLLLENPDILLLDEPTNYLDEEHIEWLKVYLRNYENSFIVISHNTDFLNSISNVIWHIENKKLTRYVGDYQSFIKAYEQNKRHLSLAYAKQQQEITRLEKYVQKNKARAATARMAQSRQKKLDKIKRIELTRPNSKPRFNFKQARTSGHMIFETDNFIIGYEYPLTKSLNLKMERGQKIALIGANGIGKSTLLKSLLKIIPPIAGQVTLGDYQLIGYFEQEVKNRSDNNVIDDVMYSLPQLTRREVRGALAKCGLSHQHIESKIAVLSGGEQTKVRLCKLMNKPTNILLLDEPTNHLDVEAKAELKRALIAYTGSILLVCHEPEFYNDIVTDIWDCEEWSL